MHKFFLYLQTISEYIFANYLSLLSICLFMYVCMYTHELQIASDKSDKRMVQLN